MEAPDVLPGEVATPTPSPTSPSPRRRWARPAGVAAIAVAVVAVVAGLYLGGHPLFGHPSSAGPSGPVTFAQARSSGDSSVQGYHGGGWSLVAAVALLSRSSISVPLAGVPSSFSGCTITPIPGAGSIVAPGFLGNTSLGVSPMWELFYRNSSEGIAIVSVIEGSAQLTATISSGSTCATLIGILATVPSPVADSPTIAAHAASSGGAQFLSAHPGANISMSLIGGISFVGVSSGATWYVDYSLCSLTAPGTAQSAFFAANVNASTGAVISSHPGTSTCLSTTPITLAHPVSLIVPQGASHPSPPQSASNTASLRRP